MFEIIVSHAARDGAKAMPRHLKERVVELLDVLETEPVPVEKYDVKKMRGLQNTYRIRLGGWRVIYRVKFSEREIIILKFEKRGTVYK